MVAGQFGATLDWGDVGNAYEAFNISSPVPLIPFTPLNSCSIYNKPGDSHPRAVFVGAGPGAGITKSSGHSGSVLILRDIVGPVLQGYYDSITGPPPIPEF